MNTDAITDLIMRVLKALGLVKPDTPTPEIPDPTSPPPPPPTVPDTIKFPTGDIKTRGPKGQALGKWSDIARWEPMWTNAVKEAGDTYGPLLLACFAVVESGGNHYRTGAMTGARSDVVTGGGNPPSVGILQVVCGFHAEQIPDADCYTPSGNIRIGAKLLAQWITSEGSWEAALTNKWHPGADPGSGYTPQTYIDTVRKLIAEVKGTSPVPPPPTRLNPFPKPVMYDLARDFARYDLTKAEADRILDNFFPHREGAAPRYIINHIQDGTTKGSLDWWANGAGVQASSTVIANRDGSLLRVIPKQHGPWTNGEVCNPTPKSAGLRALGGNPNNWSLTLEAEGEPGVAVVTYTDAQLRAILWQYAEWMIEDNIPLANVLSHATLDSCNRPACPGNANQLRVLDELKKAGF